MFQYKQKPCTGMIRLEHDTQPKGTCNVISPTSLKENDAQTKFYTGLPKWAIVLQIFCLVSRYLYHSHSKLTLEDELVLVLARLQLSLPFQTSLIDEELVSTLLMDI